MNKQKNHTTPLKEVYDNLDLPRAITSGTAHIEMLGNAEAIIDGCQGILHYDDTQIRLNLGKGSVCFEGSGLEIKSLSFEQAIIKGLIATVHFN